MIWPEMLLYGFNPKHMKSKRDCLPGMHMPVRRALLLCIFVAIAWPAWAADAAPYRRAKFEPPDGRTILFIGQAKVEIENYARDAGVGVPAGFMLYTGLERLQGLTKPYRGHGCGEAGVQDLQGLLAEFPGSAAQIGLNLVGQLEAVNNGSLDDNIRSLAEILRATNRPIFLRIGYEFDGPWNHYDPAGYVHAFQRIVRIFRGENVAGHSISLVSNVAFVWHSAGWKTFGERPIAAWYPGDGYVDWVGVSWFAWGHAEENRIAYTGRENLLRFARHHDKPLMIAESGPKQYHPATDPNSWKDWYGPLFEWLTRNNVKAYCAINQNWLAQQMWADPTCKQGMDWGDSRVQVPGSRVLKRWQDTIRSSRYLDAGTELDEAIGFRP